jgi:shikimate kinase
LVYIDALDVSLYPVSMMQREGIVLIGMAGVGKSTVGLALAKALNFSFTDLDQYILEKDRKTVQDIIDTGGDETLLLTEKQRMLEIEIKRRVIAPGGSIVYDPHLMDYLKENACIVYLNDALENIEKRLKNAASRGIVGLKNKSLRQIYDERRPLYLKYADTIIESQGKSKEQVVSEILERYHMQMP